MNKRIKELADQTVTRFEQDMDGSMEPAKWGDWISYDELEAFAELIVRECVRCVTQPTIQAEFPYDIAIRELQNVLANDMKSHFGV